MPNGIWLETAKVNDLMASPDHWFSHFEEAGITMINVLTGRWQSDNTIVYKWSDAFISKLLTLIKNRNSEFVVLAWVVRSYNQEGDPVDLRTSATRNKAIDSMMECLNKGFDGLNDNIEKYLGTRDNFVAYNNALASKVHEKNKIFKVSLLCHATHPIEVYYSKLNVDYMEPMAYSGAMWDKQTLLQAMRRSLINAGSPVLFGVAVYHDQYSFKDHLTWIQEELENQDYPKLSGFGIYPDWRETRISESDWSEWVAWTIKNAYADYVKPPPPIEGGFPVVTLLILALLLVALLVRGGGEGA